MKSLLPLIPILLLVSCVSTSHTRIEAFDLAKLRERPTEELFEWRHKAIKDGERYERTGPISREIHHDYGLLILSDTALMQLEEEIDRREDLSPEEKEAARQKRIFVGMSQRGLYSALGKPQRVNSTVTSSGVSIQHIYGSYGPYVYTLNGRITSWQD